MKTLDLVWRVFSSSLHTLYLVVLDSTKQTLPRCPSSVAYSRAPCVNRWKEETRLYKVQTGWSSGVNVNVLVLPEDLLAEVLFVLRGEMRAGEARGQKSLSQTHRQHAGTVTTHWKQDFCKVLRQTAWRLTPNGLHSQWNWSLHAQYISSLFCLHIPVWSKYS